MGGSISSCASVDNKNSDIPRYQKISCAKKKVKWAVEFVDYDPVEFTSIKIKTRDGALYKDPDIADEDYTEIPFNQIDAKYNCDRKSHHGDYKFIEFREGSGVLVPCNPVGRTGMTGRGHLGRWGPNHAADPIVTCWKRNDKFEMVYHPKTSRPILQFVAIRRKDTKQWAIPGGMRDPGEMITRTLLREFTEEALSQNVKFDKFNKVIGSGNLGTNLNNFFTNGIQIYKGYVDDPRNTDNAWMETLAMNFHDNSSNLVSRFQLRGGDDAEHAQWMDLSSELSLFASHADFLRQVAKIHEAHW